MKKLLYKMSVDEFISQIDKFKNRYANIIKFHSSKNYELDRYEHIKDRETGIIKLMSQEEAVKNGGLDIVFVDSIAVKNESYLVGRTRSDEVRLFYSYEGRELYRVFCNHPVHKYAKERLEEKSLSLNGYYSSCIPARNYTEIKDFTKKTVGHFVIEVYCKEERVCIYDGGEIEIYDTDEFFDILKNAFQEYKETELTDNINQNIRERQSTSQVIAVEFDGNTGLTLKMLRAAGYRYLLYSYIIAFEKDSRFAQGHRKLGYFLQDEIANDQSIKVIEMKIPKKQFGSMIGKGGSNIKKIEQLVGKRIKLIELN